MDKEEWFAGIALTIVIIIAFFKSGRRGGCGHGGGGKGGGGRGAGLIAGQGQSCESRKAWYPLASSICTESPKAGLNRTSQPFS